MSNPFDKYEQKAEWELKEMSQIRKNTKLAFMWASICITLLVAILSVSFWLFPTYRVWSQEMRGKAQLREAEWTKKILVEQANAEAESSILRANGLAQAEVRRAEGVAEANRIIDESLNGATEYLQYLWIEGLKNDSSKVIYVPTEGNIPIMEAGKR